MLYTHIEQLDPPKSSPAHFNCTVKPVCSSHLRVKFYYLIKKVGCIMYTVSHFVHNDARWKLFSYSMHSDLIIQASLYMWTPDL